MTTRHNDLSRPQRFVCGLLSDTEYDQADLGQLSASESEEAVRLAKKCWNVLPTVLGHETEGWLGALTSDARRELTALAHGIKAFSRIQWQINADLLRCLHSEDIPYCLLKGGAAALTLYDDPVQRAAWDFDWGVYRRDIERARGLALRAGYLHAKLNTNLNIFTPADRVAVRELEANHYELGYLVKRRYVTDISPVEYAALRDYEWLGRFMRDAASNRPWCYAVTDVHHGISLDIPTDDIIHSAEQVAWGGLKIRVPSLEWLALHLIFKIYWEGVHNYDKGLYQYADFVRVVRRMDDGGFARLESLLNQHNLVAAGHFVIRRLVHFGCEPNQDHERFVEASRTPPKGAAPADVNDMGDMWGKLWGHR